jgi:hypothetical protein
MRCAVSRVVRWRWAEGFRNNTECVGYLYYDDAEHSYIQCNKTVGSFRMSVLFPTSAPSPTNTFWRTWCFMICAQFQLAGSLTTRVCLCRPVVESGDRCEHLAFRPRAVHTVWSSLKSGLWSHTSLLVYKYAWLDRDYCRALRLQTDSEMNVSFWQNWVKEQKFHSENHFCTFERFFVLKSFSNSLTPY